MRDKSEIVLDITSQFFEYIDTNVPSWDEAYLRYEGDEISTGCTCTYSIKSEAFYVQPKDRQSKFEVMSSLDETLQELQSQVQFCVALLALKPNKYFKIRYQQSSSDIWSISKLEGQTGFPKGYKSSEWCKHITSKDGIALRAGP